jgi:hypothetical protein
MQRTLLPLGLLLVCTARACPADGAATFEDQVRPILKAYCFECHGEGESLKAGLDVRLKRFIAAGGKSGAALVPGNSDKSLLLAKVRSGEMPPGKKKLSPTEVTRIEKWIAAGAKTKNAEPDWLAGGFHITPQDRAWWAFQPIRRPPLPTLRSEVSSAGNPIDLFILRKLKEKQLDFSPEADRRTLIRRATFDLTGLPPTPEEVEAFARDESADAYDKLIDRLLASSAYGERWGRHWLDVAGYADSEGVTPEDPVRTNAWRYRDYVIQALNADKPFNQFILEQLAGDELVNRPNANLKLEDIEKLAATGFLRMAPDGNSEQKAARNQLAADTIKIVSSAFLGLTMGCAQCHNHRYDPIPQSDYYRLRAFLEPSFQVKAVRQFSLATDADREKAREIEAEAVKIEQERGKKQAEFIEQTFAKELAKLPEDIRDKAKEARKTTEAKRSPEQKKLMREHPSLNVSAGSLYLYDQKAADELKKMSAAALAVRAKKPAEEFIRVMMEAPGPLPPTFLFHRGDPDQPKQSVQPGGLSVLDALLPVKFDKPAEQPGSGRRLALARWLTDRNHPLTSRVLVNRVWLGHFGRGLVNSPGDFGRLGEAPTHPELLDWLADEFMANGWRLKSLHKLIMTSTAYRQTSQRDRAKDDFDPDNRLLHRMNLQRLEAEAVRDALLAVSGKLNAKAFGPPVPVRENDVGMIVVGKGTKDLARGTVKEEALPEGEVFRRSVYVQVRRSMPLGVLETFDGAALEPNCEVRRNSTATPQALLLLNSDFILEQARFFAERVRKEAGDDVKKQVIRAWRLAYTNAPAEADVRAGVAFVEAQKKALKANKEPALAALALYAQALLSSNRFLYVD